MVNAYPAELVSTLHLNPITDSGSAPPARPPCRLASRTGSNDVFLNDTHAEFIRHRRWCSCSLDRWLWFVLLPGCPGRCPRILLPEPIVPSALTIPALMALHRLVLWQPVSSARAGALVAVCADLRRPSTRFMSRYIASLGARRAACRGVSTPGVGAGRRVAGRRSAPVATHQRNSSICYCALAWVVIADQQADFHSGSTGRR